jgi:hypothetical protein
MSNDFRSFRSRFVGSTPMEKVLDEWQAVQRRGELLRHLIEQPAPLIRREVVRRGPGRPSWTEDKFFRRYQQSTSRLDAGATDEQIAGDFGVTPEHFHRLVRRFGRPSQE